MNTLESGIRGPKEMYLKSDNEEEGSESIGEPSAQDSTREGASEVSLGGVSYSGDLYSILHYWSCPHTHPLQVPA